ncbi:hypothetical protein L7F22_060982 [Adiantum nelumboides]|nr:hypothetical protein [Adiantum nelumboides]
MDAYNKKITVQSRGKIHILDVKPKGEYIPTVSASAITSVMKKHLSAYLVFTREVSNCDESNLSVLDKESLEAFSEVHSSVLSDLKELLMVKETDEAVSSPCSLTSGRNWGTGPNVLLQLISILIFSVHNINVGSGPESHQPTYAEILQRPVILAHAFIALFECVGFILQHCTKLDDPSNSLFLPAILVVMEWLSCRPEITAGSEAKEKEGTARTFFWKNCVNFMNRFTAGNQGCPGADDMNDRVTLWEDFELWGFTPLLPIQHKLDYVKKPDMGLGCLRERLARVKRLKLAAKVVSNMFDGSDKGMHYDDETDEFYLTGEKKFLERKHVDGVLPAETVERAPFRSVRDSQNSQQVVDPESTSAKVTLPVEEEDEEVIVFKPSSMLNQFEPIRLPVSTVDWGGGASFTMQPSRSLIPSSVNWQPQDIKINSSFWSSELHKLAPATGSFGVQSGPNLAMAKRFPLMDPSLGSLQSMGLANAAQNLSESNSMPTHSMEPLLLDALPQIKPRLQEPINVIADNSLIQSGSNLAMAKRFPFMDPSLGSLQNMGLASAAQNLSEPRLIDALVQIKPRLQESINVIAENNFGSLQAIQDFAKLKLDPGTPIDSEKPARRVTNLPSNMRPPPGFGPLPARPPLSLSATTLFQASQPASSAFATAIASLHQNTMGTDGVVNAQPLVSNIGQKLGTGPNVLLQLKHYRVWVFWHMLLSPYLNALDVRRSFESSVAAINCGDWGCLAADGISDSNTLGKILSFRFSPSLIVWKNWPCVQGVRDEGMHEVNGRSMQKNLSGEGKREISRDQEALQIARVKDRKLEYQAHTLRVEHPQGPTMADERLPPAPTTTPEDPHLELLQRVTN